MLFDDVFKSSGWKGKDDFPSSPIWKNEINNWLLYIQGKNQLKRFLPRLNSIHTKQRDKTLSEISSAYIAENLLGYKILTWEEKTFGNEDVDFVFTDDKEPFYCEVKSPSWEGELRKEELLGVRKKQPKYIDSEVRFVEPWERLRYAINKSYSKFLINSNNLLLIQDDLFINSYEAPNNIDIALFDNSTLYGGEMGYFTNSNFNTLGGILFVNIVLTMRINYHINFVPNPNALNNFILSIPNEFQYLLK